MWSALGYTDRQIKLTRVAYHTEVPSEYLKEDENSHLIGYIAFLPLEHLLRQTGV